MVAEPPPKRTPAPPAQEGLVPGPDVRRVAPLPNLRVGILTDVARVSVGADAGVVVFGQNADGSWSGRRIGASRATFVGVAPAGSAPAAKPFSAQVGSFADEASARAVAAKAEAATGVSCVVKPSTEGSRFTARVGQFASRDEAQQLATRLQREGFPGSFVVQDAAGGARGRVRLVETGDELLGATILPALESERLAVDASSYRGAIEVRAADGGALTVINVVGMQDYLKGVVPNELSPPALSRDRGPEGPGGGGAHLRPAQPRPVRGPGLRPLRNPHLPGLPRVVERAPALEPGRGRDAGHGGHLQGRADQRALHLDLRRPHRGRREHLRGEGAPYLAGVACLPERDALAEVRTSVPPRALGDEPDLTRVRRPLVRPRSPRASGLRDGLPAGHPVGSEVRSWGLRTAAALKRRPAAPASRGPSLAAAPSSSTSWPRSAGKSGRRGFCLRATKPTSCGSRTRRVRGGHERHAAALLVSEGCFQPLPRQHPAADGGHHPRPGLRAAGPGSREGGAARPPERAVLRPGPGGPLGRGRRREDLASPRPRRAPLPNLDGATAAASEVSLSPGDAVKLVLREGRIVYLEVGADPPRRRRGPGLALLPMGGPLDPGRSRARGRALRASGARARSRAARRSGSRGAWWSCVVRGSEGDLLLRGLRVRWGLGLRENLFVIERERDAKGAVASFVFTGKGWGHGVGLCQVGAFGMAQVGRHLRPDPEALLLGHRVGGARLRRPSLTSTCGPARMPPP